MLIIVLDKIKQEQYRASVFHMASNSRITPKGNSRFCLKVTPNLALTGDLV